MELHLYSLLCRNGVRREHFTLIDKLYRGADKSLARPGRKQATATEDFDVHISYTQYDLVQKPSILDAVTGYFTPSHVKHQRLSLQFLSAPEDGRK
jgi:hypothetical protein